jgi:hypothetical protein
MATLVKFVKDKEGDFMGDITAVFPQLKYNKALYGNNTYTGYVHIGQHTAVSLDYIKECTTPATEAEYMPLKRELESIGYTLKVCK